MTGLKVIDGTPTEISKYLRERKDEMTSSICKCGHSKETHNKDGICCFYASNQYQSLDCPCEKFLPQDDNHSREVLFKTIDEGDLEKSKQDEVKK